MVGTGILSNNMMSPSPLCYTTFWMMTIYSDILHWSGITPIFDPITDLDLITKFDFLPIIERFPWNICNGCDMPTEDAYSSGYLVLSHFGTCKCSNVETNVSWTCIVSGLLSFEYPLVFLFLHNTALKNFLMLSNATNQRKLLVEHGYMCPRGLTGTPAVTLTKSLKYQETCTKIYNFLNLI